LQSEQGPAGVAGGCSVATELFAVATEVEGQPSRWRDDDGEPIADTREMWSRHGADARRAGQPGL